MRSLRPQKALRAPLCQRYISSSPLTCLHASPANWRSAEKSKKKRPPPSKAPKNAVPEEREVPGEMSFRQSYIDARLAAREKSQTENQVFDPKTRLRLPVNNKYTGRHTVFRNTVLARFQVVLNEMDAMEDGPPNGRRHQQAIEFMNSIDNAFLLAEQNITRKDKNPLFYNLREAFALKGTSWLTGELRYAFQSYMVQERFSRGMEQRQRNLVDFRFPQEWLPGTREMQRTIHIHVGPTNSGKTYNALKALENSKSGVYAGPLRLLAAEVYARFTAKGLPCALITGEEIKVPVDTDQYFTSCTVEMVPLNKPVDVAVIDEIQMISDPDRGNAWTMAFLGVQAKELHVCGEERSVKLLQSLAASVGDKSVVHRYERLTPLETEQEALDGDYNHLRKGDCIVAFSRLTLHHLKRRIEKFTGRRCAIIYGSLPPEVRVQQAALFNDPDNDYDYIVASDAIGMGLNLEIRRVIMDTVFKFDGTNSRVLTDPEIKQIGGRAGRFRSASRANDQTQASASQGLVTTMDLDDLRRIQKAFKKQIPDIEHAYIEPPSGVIEQFASYYPPDTPLSFILMRIHTAAALGEQFKLGLPNDMLQVADAVQEFPLAIGDKLTFCHVPARLGNPNSVNVIRSLAKILAYSESGDILNIKAIPLEYLELDMTVEIHKNGTNFLSKMEELHDAINTYVWLSYRFTSVFRDQALAFHIRTLVEERLIYILDKLDFTEEALERRRGFQRKMAREDEWSNARIRQALEQDGPVSEGEGEVEGVSPVVVENLAAASSQAS